MNAEEEKLCAICKKEVDGSIEIDLRSKKDGKVVVKRYLCGKCMESDVMPIIRSDLIESKKPHAEEDGGVEE